MPEKSIERAPEGRKYGQHDIYCGVSRSMTAECSCGAWNLPRESSEAVPHGRMPSASGGTGVGQTDDGAGSLARAAIAPAKDNK